MRNGEGGVTHRRLERARQPVCYLAQMPRQQKVKLLIWSAGLLVPLLIACCAVAFALRKYPVVTFGKRPKTVTVQSGRQSTFTEAYYLMYGQGQLYLFFFEGHPVISQPDTLGWDPGWDQRARVPLWALLAGCGLWMTIAIWRMVVLFRRNALRGTLCITCGYDLRATPERCPECGTARVAE